MSASFIGSYLVCLNPENPFVLQFDYYRPNVSMSPETVSLVKGDDGDSWCCKDILGNWVSISCETHIGKLVVDDLKMIYSKM